jgi:putative holliday junction resolvase
VSQAFRGNRNYSTRITLARVSASGRVLGIDVGGRRVGLAISDPSRTLARPLLTLTVEGPADAVARVAAEIARLARAEDGLATIVVGAPSRLDGTPNAQTAAVDAFVAALRARTNLPIVREDERLTSREAESRLAVNERNWRRRKARLDAAAAAIILQDYLDRDGS